MNRLGLVLILAGTMVLAGGCCKSQCERRLECLGPCAQEVVRGSIDAIGGCECWSRVEAVCTDAVVTTWDHCGAAITEYHRQIIEPQARRISACGDAPGGMWEASLDRCRGFTFKAKGFCADRAFVERIESVLTTELNRVLGPLHLLDSPTVSSVESVDTLGSCMTRVRVCDSPSQAIGYYFDPVTSRLALVTSGADEPGKKGLVTTYRWQTLANGMAFPQQMQVAPIGSFALVGSQPRLEIEFCRTSMKMDD